MAVSVIVVVGLDRIISDGQFVQDAVLQQDLDILSKAGIADLGLDIQALIIFPSIPAASRPEVADRCEEQES